MERYQIVVALGALVAIGGGWPAVVGTTSMGLFIFSGIMFMVGLAIIAYGKKLRDQRS